MKSYKVMLVTCISVACLLIFGFSYKKFETSKLKEKAQKEKTSKIKGCVFRTVMGEESSENSSRFKTPEKVLESVQHGVSWIATAQNKDGGWGAGSHARQDVTDPHAVVSDPATTAMVSMALLRTGNTLRYGEQSSALKKALQYLLNAVETSPVSSSTITNERGTQIQIKLGENIDVILAAQFLSNMFDYAEHDQELKNRISKALQICVQKIQHNQQNDGSTAGAGWAGVLQSAFANSALESAQVNGIKIDSVSLEKSREYQMNNYDAKTGDSKTDLGAGVVLYSVTGSARASAKEARKVKEDIELAKKDGRLAQNAPVSPEALQAIGYASDDAIRHATAYEVYESAKVKAQDDKVMEGFGSNGGEEFLSYLQTGESMIINKDNSWKGWFDNVSGRLLNIQNPNGSWNGHHCITSPVFCTATCLLILSVNNDIDRLTKVGN
jgi:hypothetical protein